jgi:hypothetical protein
MFLVLDLCDRMSFPTSWRVTRPELRRMNQIVTFIDDGVEVLASYAKVVEKFVPIRR